ncbi:MAG: ROK family protein [Anaerolineae bacterium]|nr:hypothetical protein [Thermoflexales bacterium]MDW8406443.1 ROK family protein [Anaerolineae bacterium]
MEDLTLVKPRFTPPLDEGFCPVALASRAFRQAVLASGAVAPLVLAIERNDGAVSRYETVVFADDHSGAAANLRYAERLVKFLLWQRGGWKVYVGGSSRIGEHIRQCYSAAGDRHFDYHFMGEEVYERPFTVVVCAPQEAPPANETSKPLGRHLDGCRIGFDLGASDRKASAVIDGRPVYSEEVIWEPRKHSDPDYHYRKIMAGLKSAAAHLPRVDAIGGSSAGIIINNRPMVASLFRGVPKDRFHQVRNLFLRIADELSVPLEVINDGDVTALAGAMSLDDNGVLGIAMGSSQAAGYVDRDGNLTGWLSELAFAPVDYNPAAPADEWSGDHGVGASYFSQQCVFRLAPRAGIQIPDDIPDAEKLKFVQRYLEAGHPGAIQIW